MENEKETGAKDVESLPIEEQVDYWRKEVEKEASARQAAAVEESKEKPDEKQEPEKTDGAEVETAGEAEDKKTVVTAADDGQKKEPYKSQEEVDKAFKKRLEAERKKWEKEHARKDDGQALSEKVRKAFPGLSDDQILADLEDRELEQAAEEAGLTSEQFKVLEKRYGKTERKSEKKKDSGARLTDEMKEYVDAAAKKAEELKIDIGERMDNVVFARLILSGVDLEHALRMTDSEYEKAYESRIREEAEKKYAEKIKKRNNELPPTEKKGGSSDIKLDINNISEEELEKLSRRARRGEKIKL